MPTAAATRLTQNHRSELVLVAGVVGRQVTPVARGADTDDIDRWWDRQAATIQRTVVDGYTTSATLAERYLTAHAQAEGVTLTPVRAEPNLAQIDEALRITGPVAFKKQMRISGSKVAANRIMITTVSAAAKRLALTGARRTAIETLNSSPTVVGYRRVTAPNPCRFCTMLAERGAVYRNSSSALTVVGRGGRAQGSQQVGQSYHDSCRCTIEPLYG